MGPIDLILPTGETSKHYLRDRDVNDKVTSSEIRRLHGKGFSVSHNQLFTFFPLVNLTLFAFYGNAVGVVINMSSCDI